MRTRTITKPVPLHRQTRICTNCGDPYHRRNLVEGWTVRNPGHRKGWHKQIEKLCLNCVSVSKMHRILDIAEASFEKKHTKVAA